MRDQMLAACKRSFLFWLNAFVWTYRQKMATPSGDEVIITGHAAHFPFISWLIQDEAASQMITAINAGSDVNAEKSRDMGVTWLFLAIADWMFLFHRNVNIGVVSRKEALVDARGDMDSLFEKVRYIHIMLPNWMLPPIRSRYMHLHNLELGSTIAGESTNADVGRGGRKTVYFVDEAAAIPNAEDIESSLSQNTVCQAWVSTPRGPLTQFHKRIKENRGVRIVLPWYRHPEKSLGAYQTHDESGRIIWTSPWKAKMDAKYSRKTVAREIEMDHGQAGDIFFDYGELERHRRDHEKEPEMVGDLVQIDEMTEEALIESIQKMEIKHHVFVKNRGSKSWRFWMNLIDGRPPQHYSYAFGIDISNGSGDSNSVISVLELTNRQIVAKWWNAYTSPEELAVLVAVAGVWFGGAQAPAFVIWENNGPGGIFGRKLVKMQYPRYYRQRPDGSIRKKKTPRWGWHSNTERKEVLLGTYRDSLARDDIIMPCKESIDEAADYIYDDAGRLLPAKLREEPFGGHKLHGDHVIADALTLLAAEEIPRQRDQKVRAPKGSFAWRKDQQRKRKNKKDIWRV